MTTSSLPANLPSALRDAAVRLDGVSDTARLDAELLAAHALGMERMAMLARIGDLQVPGGFDALIARRMRDEPVAYITGRQAFWDIELTVTSDVLIPRADSETLIEAAMRYFAGRRPPENILDLGTGSGALLLAALSLFPGALGTGIDASNAALAVAQGNAEALGMAKRANIARLSWLDADWRAMLEGRFDLILCNPPYVEDGAKIAPMIAAHEPHDALFAGPDGLGDYRAILPDVPSLLTPGGVALFEIGVGQQGGVSDIASESDLTTRLRRDLSGHIRCVEMQHI